MPQEIEVRYILPAIRREFARIFIEDFRLNQKDAAKILGITEAAVSQYRHSKRAKEVVFSENVIDEIKSSAKKIIENKSSKHMLMGETFRITNLTKVKKILCDLHRQQSKDLKNCNVCFEDTSLLAIKTK